MSVKKPIDLRYKQDENFKKESEDHFRLLVEGIKDYAIFMLDPNGNIASWNEGARRMKGYEEHEILTKHFSVLYSPEDIKKNKPAIALQKAKENGSYEDEGWRVKKNGNFFWANVIITAIYKDDGSLGGFAKITRDITTQKKIQDENKLLNEKLEEKIKDLEKSESRLITAKQKMETYAGQLKKSVIELEKVFNYSVDMICTVDQEGRFTRLSNSAENILGYKPEELIGKKFTELVVDEDIEKSKKTYQETLSGTPVTNFENHYHHKNGTVVPLVWSAYWSSAEETMFCIARDATEEKKLEKAFKDEQQRFTEVFLQAPVSICLLRGENHIYQMANPCYLELTGKKNVIGKTVRDVFPELKSQGFYELLDRVYKTGETFIGKEMPVRVEQQDNGEVILLFLNFTYHAYRNSKGNIEGIFVFANDVTEQVQSRKRIEESEKRYSDLIQNLPAAVYTSNADGRIMLYNKAAVTLWGCEPKAGKDFWCTDCKTYKTDGTELAFDTSPMALTLLEGRPVFGEELIIESATGLRSHVLPYITPMYDFYRNLTGTVNMLIDITQKKQAEENLRITNERFEIVIKATNDAIWDWNLMTGEVYCNESYERLFGYPGFGKAHNIEQWLERIYIEDRDTVKDSIMKKIDKSDSDYWQAEYRYIKANGKIADVFDRGFILFDEKKKPKRFAGAMQDITERKKIEIEKEYLIAHLTNTNRNLQQFTYITSHNLKGPLSNLIGLLNIIDYNSLNTYNRDMIEMFRSSTQHLNQTINDLNQILIIKNNVNLEIDNIDIEDVFNNVCKYFTNDIENLPVSIHTNFNCREIPFNKSYLESILTNLISNSIKYRSPDRQLKIKVTTKRVNNGYILLTFSDNGMGIDLKRNKDRVFGLYQRFHSNIKGQGFGLYITKTQITSCGGTIDVESEVDKGTAFYIKFKEQI